MVKFIILFLLLACININAQQKIKVKRIDNRFFFYQAGIKNDTIIKYKSDLFFVKFPDSLQHHVVIYIQNGQLINTKNDSLFQFMPVSGMKYSLSKPDSTFITMLEGVCTASKNITIEVLNKRTDKIILKNKFLVK